MLNSRDISLLRPDVAVNCRKLIELCKAEGFPVLVTSTVRDDEYQAYLYEQGRTRPGSIVTNGKYPTFHWDQAGLAFDVCKNVKGQEYSDAAFFCKFPHFPCILPPIITVPEIFIEFHAGKIPIDSIKAGARNNAHRFLFAESASEDFCRCSKLHFVFPDFSPCRYAAVQIRRPS